LDSAVEKFIKLYPHHLQVQRHEDDSYLGQLSFSVEQYGLLLDNFEFRLHLLQPNEHYDHWRFACEDPAQLKVPNFLMFLKSIEHHVFWNLKFSPQQAVLDDAQPKKSFLIFKSAHSQPFRLYFQNMFFDTNTSKLKHVKD
jgi:hypothetical protein